MIGFDFLQNYQNLGLTHEDLATDDIAKAHDEIVGYASFNMDKAPEEVCVQLLCVKPKYQGQGIGKHLLYSILQMPRVQFRFSFSP